MFSTGCTTPSISSLSIRESLYRSFDTSQSQSSQHNDYSPYHRMGDIKAQVSTDCKYIIPMLFSEPTNTVPFAEGSIARGCDRPKAKSSISKISGKSATAAVVLYLFFNAILVRQVII